MFNIFCREKLSVVRLVIIKSQSARVNTSQTCLNESLPLSVCPLLNFVDIMFLKLQKTIREFSEMIAKLKWHLTSDCDIAELRS